MYNDLVDRMTLNIEGVRPALLKRKNQVLFQELRSFRHFFRNIYQSSLDVQKLTLINNKVPESVTTLQNAHGHFVDMLKIIAEGLEE